MILTGPGPRAPDPVSPVTRATDAAIKLIILPMQMLPLKL
jgi:hypothetical protein